MSAVSEAVLTPDLGSELVADLGFLHVPGRPAVDGRAYLFVALRNLPTLRHFDPERVDYWVATDGRGTQASIDRSTRSLGEGTFAWGTIEVVDRKGVSNEFIGFGGALAVRRYDDLTVAVFSSDAPIAARGGHSQGWDHGTYEMAAFAARLRAAAGASPSFERRLDGLSPIAVYAAFIADSIERQRDRRGGLVGDGRLYRMAAQERRRLRSISPDAWRAGAAIAGQLD